MTALPNTVTLEYFGEVNLYIGIGIQIIAAMFLGGLVGYDREKKMKAAGLKTNILICVGAALYTIISLLNLKGVSPVGAVDPNRVAAQIVSGIGFLGAGAIIQGRGHIIGLTTAAVIWVVAAIGFTIGSGYILSAALFTLTVMIILKLIGPVYTFMEWSSKDELYHIEILSKGSVKSHVSPIIFSEAESVEKIFEEYYDQKKERRVLFIDIRAHARQVERIMFEIKSNVRVEKATFNASTDQESD